MPDWNAATAALNAAVADTFDTDTLFAIGRKQGVSVNSERADDPARPQFEFKGSFELLPDGIPLSERPQGDSSSLREAVSHEAVVSAIVTGWAWLPRRKDHILRGAERWEITDLKDDGSPRKVYYLNRA